MNQKPEISLVIPFLNEEGSLGILYGKILDALEPLAKNFEIIFVNDGSNDGSLAIVDAIHQRDPRVKIIHFPANRGKAAALNKGFEAACGDIIFTLDADLQDDPEEIPNFLRKIDEGCDLVSGWKKKRLESTRKAYSFKAF